RHSATPPHPQSPAFPYTTLFRSLMARADSAITGHNVEDVLARYAQHRAQMNNTFDPSRILPSGEDIYAPVLKRTGEYVPESEPRSEEHTSELQSRSEIVCRLWLE